jgi:hypothetical protein
MLSEQVDVKMKEVIYSRLNKAQTGIPQIKWSA